MEVQVEAPIDIVAAVERLSVPRPFTLERLVEAVAACQPKPIVLVKEPLGGTVPCGWLVRTGEVDYICYPTNTSRSHQLHIVLHELGHLVLGHVCVAVSLAHAGRDTEAERAAETFATMAARRITRVLRLVEWILPEGD